MIRRFLSWLFGGPQCVACDEHAITERTAIKGGWRWGTYAPGEACWLCKDCWNGQGSE